MSGPTDTFGREHFDDEEGKPGDASSPFLPSTRPLPSNEKEREAYREALARYRKGLCSPGLHRRDCECQEEEP